MINTILFNIAFTILLLNSQCLPENQSPNNPTNANCEVGFFDIESNPLSNCICCVPNADDGLADECIDSPTKIGTGLIECSENFDCCACDEIICNDCDNVKCNGDSSCIGVSPFTISGSDSGTTIDCNGDVSCFRTSFEGTNIKEILCSGDNSCEETNFELTCIDTGCSINFGGDGLLRDFDNIYANIANVALLSCSGDESCPNSEFILDCIDTGCPIQLGGDIAAFGSTFTIDQASEISCSAGQSCSNATFAVTCIDSGCAILCSRGCPNAEFNIVNSNGVSCEGVITFEDGAASIGTCEGAVFILDNNIGERISCAGVKACKDAIFSGIELTPITNIGGIQCSGSESCFDTLINVECDDENGCELGCDGNNACSATSNATFIDIINIKSVACNGGITASDGGIIVPACGNRLFNLIPLNSDFSISCSGSCVDSIFNVDTDLSSIKSIECSNANVCEGTSFNIASTGTNGIIINEVKCGSSSSCKNSLFSITTPGDITLSSFECGNSQSCQDIDIIINLESTNNDVSLNIICGGVLSCQDATVSILVDNTVLSETDIELFDITISCGGQDSCSGATINGIPFTNF